MNTLINISGKIDKHSITIYEAVADSANKLNISYMVVGASARDLVLYHGYGAKIKRATADIDFGIQVQSWSDFDALKRTLIERDFKESKEQHRLYSPGGMHVDLVPFGAITNGEGNIGWPPDGDIVMNVTGFQEVFDNAHDVRIRDNPVLDIPVATLPGLSILKLLSWQERDRDLKRRDALDLIYLLKNYEVIPVVMEQMYEFPDMMQDYDGDVSLSGAHVLGRHAREIAGDDTAARIIDGYRDEELCARLVEGMCRDIESEFGRNRDLFMAWMNGFTSTE
ncbi:MAG: nucleotidyl transferase AbiEii/AbiGii toxin family protein [Gammaproteobacteria bacterium]